MPTTATIPQQLAQMDHERLRAYRDNLAFYQGQQWPASPRWNRHERRLTFNYAKAFVEKATSYLLLGANVVVEPWDDSPDAAERARRADAALLRIADENDLALLDFDTELDTAILGDGAFKVIWDVHERQVRISAPDVQGLFVWTAGDDPSRVWRVASRYTLSPEAAEMIYGIRLPARPGSRRDVKVVEVWTDQRFELWLGEGQPAPVESKPNPYGFIPYIIYPNLRAPKSFWGMSDLEPLKDAIRELNRALSQLSMILELSGNPIAVLEGVSESSDIAVQPGAVWELPERARAYLLDLLQGGGIRLHVDYIDLIYRTLHDLSETPRTAFGENRQGLSGVALQMELDPLLKKVQRKRLIRSAVYRRRAEMVLRILEQRTGSRYLPCRLKVVWAPLLPSDRSRLVDDEVKLVGAGIHSRQRAAAELGVEDPQREFDRWLAEQRQTDQQKLPEPSLA